MVLQQVVAPAKVRKLGLGAAIVVWLTSPGQLVQRRPNHLVAENVKSCGMRVTLERSIYRAIDDGAAPQLGRGRDWSRLDSIGTRPPPSRRPGGHYNRVFRTAHLSIRHLTIGH